MDNATAARIIDEALGHDCEGCGNRVIRCDNGIYLDPEPNAEGALMHVMPIGHLRYAAGGGCPPGVKRFRLHEHQPGDPS